MAAVNFESPPIDSPSRRSLFGTCLDKVPKMDYDPLQCETHGGNSTRVVNLSDLRQSYENQKSKLKQIDDDMKQTREKALRFQVQEQMPSKPSAKRVNSTDPVFDDLFKPKPAKHHQRQYAYPYQIMGDVFSSGPEYRQSSGTPQIDTTPRHGRQSGAHSQGFDAEFLTHRPCNSNNNSNNQVDFQNSGPSSQTKLPANIKHSFGSQTCNELLSDPSKVSETLEKQKQSRRSRLNDSDVPSMLKPPLSTYEDLGHSTRLNLFPGLSVGGQKSAMKTYHNEEVFLNRYIDPDSYRMKKDELSTWSEHNILRQKDSLLWQQYLETLPKQTITWDRSATRTKPPPPEKSTASKPKKLPPVKPKKQTSEKNDVIESTLEEEFVFKTPPLTPPPVVKSPEKFPESFTRDDDFWDFFDQPIPK